MSKIRILTAAAISLVPVNAARLFLYRRVLGYKIGSGCRIGMLTVIACRSFEIGDKSIIRSRNVLKGKFAFRAGRDLFIGDGNAILAPWGSRSGADYAMSITFGDDCLVNDRHFIDVHGSVTIGDGTWIAGRDSQFYTHGVSATDRDITIGPGCYIGTAVRFAPGSGVGRRVLVGLGSVVVGRIEGDEILVSGFPARPLRSIAEDLAQGRYRFSKLDWG